jgi:citrate lyase beta subunit
MELNVDDFNTAVDEIDSAVSDIDDAVEIDDKAEKRQKLIQSIEDGEIDNLKTSTVKKATRTKLDKYYTDYERTRLKKAN